MNHTITTTDKDGGTHEVPLSEIVWRPAAYAIIIQERKILMVPQWDGYDLPGGGVDIHERIEEGVIREVKEETGFDVVIDACVTTRDSFFTFRKKWIHTHSIAFYYTAHIIGGEISGAGFDGDEKEYMKLAEWIPFEKFHELKIHSSIDIKPIVESVIHTTNI